MVAGFSNLAVTMDAVAPVPNFLPLLLISKSTPGVIIRYPGIERGVLVAKLDMVMDSSTMVGFTGCCSTYLRLLDDQEFSPAGESNGDLLGLIFEESGPVALSLLVLELELSRLFRLEEPNLNESWYGFRLWLLDGELEFVGE